ncbi:hypothetical protein AM270_26065 [Escherichia coli]|nr:hypothetical protein AM270_26065 [Escherichia coli]
MKFESLSVNFSFFYNVIFLGWMNYPQILSIQLSFSSEIILGSSNLLANNRLLVVIYYYL